MGEEVETIRIEEAPGLVARVYSDDVALEWPYETGWCEVAGEMAEGRQYGDLGWISCPNCHHSDGSTIGSEPGLILGVKNGEFYDSECPCCEGRGWRRAKSGEEWSKANGVKAALPVSHDFRGPYGVIRVEDWDDSYDSILYTTEGGADTLEGLESAVKEIEMILTEGYYGVVVEVDPDSDALPDDVLNGCMGESLWGILGWDGYGEEAVMLLKDCYAIAKDELAERESWAKRDVVTA